MQWFFIDDNPFERNLVQLNLPDVIVPDLPEDPAEYLDYLQQLNLFETASYTSEDELRNKQYKEEANRMVAQKNFVNEDDFLASLNMTSLVTPFNKFNTPRVAQLSQRSNQFNLRTIRYTEEAVQQLSHSTSHVTFAFDLKDKFGDNGLICIVVLKKENKVLFIENWLMSCRVLKRDMENFTLNTIVSMAKKSGFEKIVGEFVPTSKNGIVKNHFENLGFKSVENFWDLDVNAFENRKCFIQAI